MLGQEPAGPLPVQGALTRPVLRAARTVAGVLAVAWLFGGCVTGAEVAGLATQDEVMKLRSDVTSLQRSLQQAKAQTDGLSGQLAARPAAPAVPATDVARQAEGINHRLDSLAGTLTALSKRVDDLTGRVDALGRQVRASAIRPGPGMANAAPQAVVPPPIPPALGHSPAPTSPAPSTAAPVTASPSPAASVTASPSTAAPVAPRAPATTAPAPGPTRSIAASLPPHDLYQASYIDFSKGNYALAIDGFREFLRRYPDHAQAGNAQYWIGEGYAAMAQQYTNSGQHERATDALQRAVQEFRKVVANYPRGDRAPSALYKEALTLVELKQPALAQSRLQYLVDNFPQAEEIPLARERLASLKK